MRMFNTKVLGMMAIALAFSLMPTQSNAQTLTQKCCEGLCCTGSTVCDNCDRSCCLQEGTVTNCDSCSCSNATCMSQCSKCMSAVVPDENGGEVNCSTCNCLGTDATASLCQNNCHKCKITSLVGCDLGLPACNGLGDDVYDCSTKMPTCDELGFTMTPSDCVGVKYIKCPTDFAKVFCFQPSCGSGEEWCESQGKCVSTCDGFDVRSGGLEILCFIDQTQVDCTDCLGNKYIKCLDN